MVDDASFDACVAPVCSVTWRPPVSATGRANFVILESDQPLFTDFGNVPFAPGNEKTELTFIVELRVRQRAFELGFETDDVLPASTAWPTMSHFDYKAVQ